jgi:hypothetical protein
MPRQENTGIFRIKPTLLPPSGLNGHNPDMGHGWLLLALLLLTIGCTPADKTTTKSQTEHPADVLVDAFNLPLVITIKAPEVPSEIAKPSAPIKNESIGH